MPAPLTAALGIAGSLASTVAPLLESGGAMSLNKIKAVAEDFESVFLSNMLEEMFAGVAEEDPFGNGEGAAAWRSIQTEEFARSISRAGGIGLAEHVQRHLLSLQENQS